MKRTIYPLVLSLLLLTSFNIVSAQSTYTVNGTTYVLGEYYETGHPKVKRNQANVDKFLKNHGYSNTPSGYQVDHIIPLSQGGKDTPDNMQLIPTYQHKNKTASERKNGHYSPSVSKFSLPTAGSTIYKQPTYNYKPTAPYNYSGKTIQTGSRGGKSYINSNGNKTYIKK